MVNDLVVVSISIAHATYVVLALHDKQKCPLTCCSLNVLLLSAKERLSGQLSAMMFTVTCGSLIQ